MSIASEIQDLLANKASIKAAIEAKSPSVAPTDDLASFPAAIASIQGGGSPDGPWVKPDAWPDIKAILAADTHNYAYKRIELLNDQQLATYLTGGIAFYTSEGNFYSSPTTFTWDPSKDIVASDGSRYRWVISFSTNGNFNNGCGVGTNLLWYLLGTGSYATHTFNGRSMCQKIEGTFSSTASGSFAGMTSLVEIEGAISYNSANCNNLLSDDINLRRIVGTLSCPSMTSCTSMFSNCQSLVTLPAGFTATGAQNCSTMFNACYSLKKLPEGFSCSSSTNTSYMFLQCRALESLPSGFKCASGANMFGLFYGCLSLKEIPDSLVDSINNAVSVGSIFQDCVKIRRIPPIESTTVTNIAGFIRGIGPGVEIPELDFGNSPITGYGDFSHASWSFPDVIIATNMTGTAAFPAGYLYTNKIPIKVCVNVPVNLPCSKVGTGQKDRVATFDSNDNLTGGIFYNVYDLTSDPSYVSGTYKEFRLYQLSNDIKNSFTTAQKDAIGAYLNSKGWTLNW